MMSVVEANKYLEQVQSVVNSIETTILLAVGVQGANTSNLNYKVFRGTERLTDFEIFGLIPRDPNDAHAAIAEAFAKYTGIAKVIS